MGKNALSPSSPRAEEQGRGTALAGGGQSGRPGPWRRPGVREKEEGGAVGRFSHLIWVKAACGGAATVVGGGRLWGLWWRRCGDRRRPGLGEKGRGR